VQYDVWACRDPRPRLGYCVSARELIPAGSFVFEYCGQVPTRVGKPLEEHDTWMLSACTGFIDPYDFDPHPDTSSGVFSNAHTRSKSRRHCLVATNWRTHVLQYLTPEQHEALDDEEARMHDALGPKHAKRHR
jgi:hypothetical protein